MNKNNKRQYVTRVSVNYWRSYSELCNNYEFCSSFVRHRECLDLYVVNAWLNDLECQLNHRSIVAMGSSPTETTCEALCLQTVWWFTAGTSVCCGLSHNSVVYKQNCRYYTERWPVAMHSIFCLIFVSVFWIQSFKDL